MSLLRLEESHKAALASLDQILSENGFTHVGLALFLSLEVEFKLDKFLTEFSINDDELLLILSFSENILHNCIKKHLFDLIVSFELVLFLGVFDIIFPAFFLSFEVLEHVDSELVEFSVEVIWRDKVDGELNLLDGIFLSLQFFFHLEGLFNEFLLFLIIFLSDELIFRSILMSSSTTPVVIASSLTTFIEVAAFVSFFVLDAVLNLTIYQWFMDDEFDIGL